MVLFLGRPLILQNINCHGSLMRFLTIPRFCGIDRVALYVHRFRQLSAGYTCCIDRKSRAELSKANNSIFLEPAFLTLQIYGAPLYNCFPFFWNPVITP